MQRGLSKGAFTLDMDWKSDNHMRHSFNKGTYKLDIVWVKVLSQKTWFK